MNRPPKTASLPRGLPPEAMLLQQAIAHHRAGRLSEAEAGYRRILTLQPRQTDALNLLGLVRYQRGDAAGALTLIDQALATGSRNPECHNNRGLALARLGRSEEAAASFRRALALRPGYAEAQYNLGNALRALGDSSGACAAYRAALRGRPDLADAHMNLGNLLAEAGELDEAVMHLEKAVALRPNSPVALSNLGLALLRQDRLEAAEARLRAALQAEPRSVEARYNMARLCFRQRDFTAVEEHCRALLELQPDHAEARLRLGRALLKLDRVSEALAEFTAAAALQPGDARTHLYSAIALFETNALAAAAESCRLALALDPAFARAKFQLANALLAAGQVEPALAAFAEVVDDPDCAAAARANRLMALNYADDLDPGYVAELHRETGAWLQARTAPLALPARSRDPDRALRIGYVSSDMRRHSCAFFLEPLLASHDRSAHQVFCYFNGKRADAVTDRLRGYAQGWRDVFELDDAALAEQVREDGIDILVDLNGHTDGNRLGVFAMKPAPIQVSWLGYPNTTGLTRIDYRLTDATADPAGASEAWHTETLVRLDRVFLCYRPIDEAPPVSPLPAQESGTVTFGSFNAIQKISPATIAAWADILQALPSARLVLKAKALGDEPTRVRYRAMFDARGIEPERVGLFPFAVSQSEGLQGYTAVDIALDPFPYNGTTTTCEALWMGVPVITLQGDRHVARVGSSLLRAVGLEECVATDLEDYRRRAVAMASDLPRLAALRAGLRERMAASPLCDGPDFARAVEQAYRAMWRRWCAAG